MWYVRPISPKTDDSISPATELLDANSPIKETNKSDLNFIVDIKQKNRKNAT